ncbi:hypothetical protein ACLOJK_000321 [Asimina triloba]
MSIDTTPCIVNSHLKKTVMTNLTLATGFTGDKRTAFVEFTGFRTVVLQLISAMDISFSDTNDNIWFIAVELVDDIEALAAPDHHSYLVGRKIGGRIPGRSGSMDAERSGEREIGRTRVIKTIYEEGEEEITYEGEDKEKCALWRSGAEKAISSKRRKMEKMIAGC